MIRVVEQRPLHHPNASWLKSPSALVPGLRQKSAKICARANAVNCYAERPLAMISLSSASTWQDQRYDAHRPDCDS